VGVLADEVLVEFDGASIRRDESFSPPVAFRVDESLFNKIGDGTREIALTVVELRRELGDRVAPVDRGEDFEFDAPEHGVTLLRTFYIAVSSSVTASGRENRLRRLNQQNYAVAGRVG